MGRAWVVGVGNHRLLLSLAEHGALWLQAPVLLSMEKVHARAAVPTRAQVLLVRAAA